MAKRKSAWEEALNLVRNVPRGFANIKSDYSRSKVKAWFDRQAKEVKRIAFDQDYRKFKRGETYWKPLASVQRFVERDLTNLPKFSFAEKQVAKARTPVGRFATQVGLGIPQSFLNAPSNYLEGIAKTGISLGKQTRQLASPAEQAKLRQMSVLSRIRYTQPRPEAVAGLAQTGEAILDAYIATNIVKNLLTGTSRALVKQAPRSLRLTPPSKTFASTLLGGTKIGARYGAGYGFLAGLQEGAEEETVGRQLLGTAPYVVGGTVAGAAFGTALVGVSYAVRPTMNKLLSSPKIRRIFFKEKGKVNMFTPKELRAAAAKTKNPTIIRDAEKMAKTAENLKSNVMLGVGQDVPTTVGKGIGLKKTKEAYTYEFFPTVTPGKKTVVSRPKAPSPAVDIVPPTQRQFASVAPFKQIKAIKVAEIEQIFERPSYKIFEKRITDEAGNFNVALIENTRAVGKWLENPADFGKVPDLEPSRFFDLTGNNPILSKGFLASVAQKSFKQNSFIHFIENPKGEAYWLDLKHPRISTEEINKLITEQGFQGAVMPPTENRLAIGVFGEKDKKILESLAKLLKKEYNTSSEIIRGNLTFPESNKYGQLTQQAQKEIQATPPVRGIGQPRADSGVKEGLEKPPKTRAEEVIEKTPEPIAPLESTQNFWLAMKQLRKLRGYSKVITAPKTDEELALAALAAFRGYKTVPPEVMKRLTPQAFKRVQQLMEMVTEFGEEVGLIEDVLRNYKFYTKRFGKLLTKGELRGLKVHLNKSVKVINKEISELRKQTIEVEKPAPTNLELAIEQAKLQARTPAQVTAAGAPQAKPPSKLPSAPPPAAPPGGKPKKPKDVISKKSIENVLEKEEQENLTKTLEEKSKIEGTPPPAAKEERDVFNAVFSKWVGERSIARTQGIEASQPLVKIPAKKGLEVIKAREAGGSDDPIIDAWVKDVGEITDELYNIASRVEGINLAYLENYITHIWDKPFDETAEMYRTFKTKFRFENERLIPTYEEGIKMGLKPRFTHPAQVVAYYTTNLYQSIANIKAFEALKEAGVIVPAAEGASLPGYTPITAPGVNRSIGRTKIGKKEALVFGDYYAPKVFADIMNRVFSPSQSPKKLKTTARIAGALQDLRLSGGAPFTPINAWTLGQLYKELAASAGSFIFAPWQSTQRSFNAVGSVLDALIPGRTKKIYLENVGQVKKMQGRDVPSFENLQIDDFIDKSKIEQLLGTQKGIKPKIKHFWTKAIFEATFKRFMPLMHLKMFNLVEREALKKGYSPEESADIGADAVRQAYGIIKSSTKIKRSAALNDALTVVFFAPRYRETMFNMWLSSLVSILPVTRKGGKIRLQNPLSIRNKHSSSLILGTVLVYLLYDLLNRAFNDGRGIADNPPGAEDKLLLPDNKGGILGIPLFPSTLTLPRAGYRIANRLVDADFKGAAAEMGTFMSVAIKPAYESFVTGEDYFGRRIYEDTDPREVRLRKIGKYLALQYNHPWIEAIMDQRSGKYPTAQNISKALELPLRFYTSKSISSRYFYGNLAEARKTLSPNALASWDKLYQKGKSPLFGEEDGLVIYDTRNKMENALVRLEYPEIVRAETDAAIKTAQDQGTPVNPFYLLTPDQQMTVLILKTFYPGEATYKQIRDDNIHWLKPYWDINRAWRNEMVKLGIFEDRTEDQATQSRRAAVQGLMAQGIYNVEKITNLLNEGAIKSGFKSGDWTAKEVNQYIAGQPYLTPSPELQAKLDYYSTLPKGTGARSRYLRANPDVKQFFELAQERTNMSRLELGLPPTGYGYGGGGYGQYQRKIRIKLPKAPATRRANLRLSKPAQGRLRLPPRGAGIPAIPVTRATRAYTLPKVNVPFRTGLPQTISGLGR